MSVLAGNLLTKEEAAFKLRICISTLNTLLKQEHFNKYKVGKKVLLSESEINSYLERNGNK